MALTLATLTKFVKLRNKSDLSSNLQFGFDADACGFKAADLGEVRSFVLDGFKGYEWNPIIRQISGRHSLPVEKRMRLVEFGSTLHLKGVTDSDRMFELMNRAEYQTVAA